MQHSLQGRTESELLWFQRRSFLQAAAAWTTLGGAGTVWAQGRTNVVERQGDALVNGLPLMADQSIQSGDQIATGPRSTLIFTVGNSAFHVRQNSNIVVERGSSLNVVSLLRLVTGAVVSVWGKGHDRQILTPTLTAGIRGTGVYTEVFDKQDGRTYFCDCYGTVDLASGKDRDTSVAEYHQSFWGEANADERASLIPARAINHTDEEVEYLARLIGERTAWQISGRKGTKETERSYGG